MHESFVDHSTDGGQESSPLDQRSDFSSWAICLPRWITRCRTTLPWHLVRSFTASRRSSSSPSATFPLPGPHPRCFGGGGPSLSRKRLQSLAGRRVLYIFTYCLNCLPHGRYPMLDEPGRRPDKWQLRCAQCLRSLLVVCGDSDQDYTIVPGRSGPELGAAFFQLEEFLVGHPELSGDYVTIKQTKFVFDPDPLSTQKHIGLAQHKNIDADRLRLVGDGRWPMAKFLDGPLWLLFLEPRCLLHGQDISNKDLPNFAFGKHDENLKLCLIWDPKFGMLSAC